MEAAANNADAIASAQFRRELDEARNARLGSSAAADEKKSKKEKKHKKEKKKDKDKDKKKRKRHSRSDSDSDSDEKEEKKKKKKDKKSKGMREEPVERHTRVRVCHLRQLSHESRDEGSG